MMSNAQVENTGEFLRYGFHSRRRPWQNMTAVNGIDPTQDALARWIAANADTVSTVPGAGPRLFHGIGIGIIVPQAEAGRL